MRKFRFALVSSLTFSAGLGSAWGQTPAPTTPPPAEAPAAAPAPAPAAAEPAPAPAPEPAPAPAPAEPAPAPAAEPIAMDPGPMPATADMAPPPMPAAEEEESYPAAWFRIDSDLLGLQLWAGATHPLSDTVGIASDIYVVDTIGEFDIGPSFTAGPMYVTPMIGLQVDWSLFEAVALVPQLFVTGGPDPIYLELWIQDFMYNVFDDTNGPHALYTRFFIDYKAGKYIGFGPQVEATFGLNDAAKAGGETLVSLPVGANVMLTDYGKNNILYIFGGYETQDTANDSHLAGRLTFIHNF